jgi:hypothetical protein
MPRPEQTVSVSYQALATSKRAAGQSTPGRYLPL